MISVFKNSSIDWKPSGIVALATSADNSQVAAARADNSLEIWLVSPGSVGWHCQLTIHGDPNSRVSSLVWCRSGPRGGPLGRLLSSNFDGSVSEWDFVDLKQKTVLDSIGATIWQIAAELREDLINSEQTTKSIENGRASTPIDSDVDDESDDDEESDESSDDDERDEVHDGNDEAKNTRLAMACDDGYVRICRVSDEDSLVCYKTLPKVAGRTMSVAWSTDSSRIYSGSSDGFIRCWDAKSDRELYRITVGHGGLGSGSDLCIWSLLALKCGTIVSGDSSGCVQFWDSQFGTLLQAHSNHKGDVNALAAAPSHGRVFSAGSDGQVVQYKFSSDATNPEAIKRWIYVGYIRAHTHDLRAMTVAIPISQEDSPSEETVKRSRRSNRANFSYHKWAHLGVPMLISGSDDTKLFAYSIRDFTKFSPHDICPAPQRMPMQLVPKTKHQPALLLMQATNWVDIYCVRFDESAGPSTGLASLDLVARVKCKASRKIICSTMSSSGSSFCYSDHLKPSLFELKTSKSSKNSWTVSKKKLPPQIPFAHSMVYTSDSTRLILAGHDRRIYIVDVGSSELVHHTFTPRRDDGGTELTPSEPPITKMFTSTDNQWLAAINCFGDLYVFNLETLRQHWFVSRLDGASVTAAGFIPKKNSNILILSTSSNQVYALDVESKQLGEWSKNNTSSLPRRYQEFPGEVTGLSFQPSSSSSSVIVYSPRAMCLIDFGMPIDKDTKDTKTEFPNEPGLTGKMHRNGGLKRKLELNGQKNFELCTFNDPVLFVEHLSETSLLVIDKQWVKVVKTFDTQPVHRHIYGT